MKRRANKIFQCSKQSVKKNQTLLLNSNLYEKGERLGDQSPKAQHGRPDGRHEAADCGVEEGNLIGAQGDGVGNNCQQSGEGTASQIADGLTTSVKTSNRKKKIEGGKSD